MFIICSEIQWFWEIHFSPHIWIFLGAYIFLTSLRLFVKEKFSQISQSLSWLYKKHKSLKKLESVYNTSKYVNICLKIMCFWKINSPLQTCIFFGAGNFLANLRLFVKEIFLRSRRAHRDCSKNTKVWKSHKIHTNALYTYKFPLNSSVLRNPL